MKMKYLLSCVFFITLGHLAVAQYPYINHFDWMKQQHNPAALGINRIENVLLNYNRSWISKEVNSNLGILQYDRPLITANNRNLGGIGGFVSNNRVSYKEVFNRFQLGLSAAFAAQVGKTGYLNFGLQGTYNQDNVNNHGLLTGSQYVPGWGFDPGIGNNEPSSNLNTNYFGINAGIMFYQANDGVLPDNYIGISVKNMNRPYNSFLEDQQSQLAPLLNVNAGLLLLETMQGKILTDLYYSNYSGIGNFTVGVNYEFLNLLSRSSSMAKQIDLRVQTRYSFNNKLMLGGQLIYDRFVFGFIYDVPTGATERSFDSGFEFLLGIQRKVKPPNRKKKRKRGKKSNTKATLSKTIVQPAKVDTLKIEETPVLVVNDTTNFSEEKSGDAQIGLISETPPISNYIYFDFASKNLTTASENSLQKMVLEFQKSEKSMIVLTGHTDNKGPADYNLDLSNLRAEAVKQRLIEKGIPSDQIEVIGKGESKPIAPNDSEENRTKNRRVEVTFY